MLAGDRAMPASGILGVGHPSRANRGPHLPELAEAAGASPIFSSGRTFTTSRGHQEGVHPTPEVSLSAIEQEVKSGRMARTTPHSGQTAMRSGRVRLQPVGLSGPSYLVSAACATSLVALHSAIQMIRNGIIDAAIVGGGEDNLSTLHFLEFSALGALFGLSGQERPAHETSAPSMLKETGWSSAKAGE